MLPYATEQNVVRVVTEKLKEGGVIPSEDAVISIVNNAIESGEIEISGGTKLYKHTMKFEGGTVYLINNSSEVITERFGAYLAFHNANCISAKMIEGPHVYIVLNISLNGDEDETISFLTEEGETMSFPVSFKSDTVTEL